MLPNAGNIYKQLCHLFHGLYISHILESMISWITYIGTDLKLLIHPSIFSWCNVHCHFLFLICRIHFSTLVVYCPSFCKTANVCANSLHMHGFLWVEVSTKLKVSLQNNSVKSWYLQIMYINYPNFFCNFLEFHKNSLVI